MPNPLFLEVMRITIHEYNSYSPAKKARFQKAAQQKLAQVQESNIDAYIDLTKQVVETTADNATELAQSVAEDEEFK